MLYISQIGLIWINIITINIGNCFNIDSINAVDAILENI